MNRIALAKWKIFASMFIFGTIGIFVRHISLPSHIIALVRGVIGVIFLMTFVLLKGGRLDLQQVKKNLLWLCLSGAAIGFNWIFLFEAYNYTSVAVATLCYYMSPVIIILVSPFILRERLTAKKCLCVVVALFGMVCISGILAGELPRGDELIGIAFGLAAAVLYACVVLMNKQLKEISAFDRTILQLGISAIVLLPYCLAVTDFSALQISSGSIPMLVLLGIVHTGLAYLLYFGGMEYVPGQTAAMISYVDPAIAVLASVMVLREPMMPVEAVGAVLILGAALLSETNFQKRKRVGL